MAAYILDPLDTSFTQVLNRILFDTTLSMGARLTYAALVEHYRTGSDSCWPSMARLASMVGVKSARTVQNYMKELITRGLVTVVKRGCWQRCNEYRLHALVTLPAAQERQGAPGRDMANLDRRDIRKRSTAQVYPTNIVLNNRAIRRFNSEKIAKEAGAVAFARRHGLLK